LRYITTQNFAWGIGVKIKAWAMQKGAGNDDAGLEVAALRFAYFSKVL
jgi:hypothetical protein